MIWFAVWTVLVLLAGAVLGRLAWRVFRQGVAVVGEMGRAGARLSALTEQVERLGGPVPVEEPAVFSDPVALRRARDRRRRRGSSPRPPSTRRTRSRPRTSYDGEIR